MARIKRGFLLLMCFVYFIDAFSLSSLVHTLLIFIVCITFLLSITTVDKKTMVMGGILFVSGIIMNIIVNGEAVISTMGEMLQNLPLLVLMTLSPLLAIPLKNSGYIDSIQRYLKQVKDTPHKLFTGLTSVLFLITPVLSLGSVRILHEILQDNKFEPAFLARAYFVGFSTAMVWSPYFGSVALSLYYLEIPFSRYILFGLLLACLQLAVGNLIFFLFQYKQKEKQAEEKQRSEPMLALLLKIVALLAALIGTLVWIESWTQLSMLLLVSLTSVIIPMLWALITRKWKLFCSHVKTFVKNMDHSINTETVLFLSAGLFGAAVAASPFSDVIQQMFEAVSSISFLLVATFIILLVIGLAFIGVHQIITVPVLAIQITPETLGTDPISLIVVLLLAWFMAAIISPFNAITIFISNVVHRSTLTVGLRWNGLYIASMYAAGMMYVSILHYIL
ncbi:hypothetical protein [Salibacterium aidingense]|uniref:hypothetical protein n=1 Tax=Salibacterium aidingense TaxID=384933 RepID=UPI003BC7AEA7